MTESLITEFGSWIEGMPPFLNFIIIIFLITVTLFRTAITTSIKKINWEKFQFFKKNKKESIDMLIDHDIFNTIERVRSEVKNQKFYTHGDYDSTKTKMFHTFMENKLDIIRKRFKNFLNNIPETKSMDGLKSELLKTMRVTIEEYTKKTEKDFIDRGVPKESSDYIIALFEEWRKPTIKALNHRIDNVFASDFHKGKFEKLLGSLEILSMAIDLIPRDGVSAFKEMNGKFKNLEF